MENNIEILENIMKPYLEKKEQIENSKTEKNVEINTLKRRLENLLDNKEREIDEYISEVVNSNSNFYSGYGAMIRKDLELAYKEKEDELRKEIADLENALNYERVDLREIAELKEEIKKQLHQEQKRLNIELKREKIKFDVINLDLDEFKYEYNEQNQVTNGSAWRQLYEASNESARRIRSINEALANIEKAFNEMELTKEEGAAILRTMTPWEEEEYNRRKSAISIEENVKTADEIFEDTQKMIDDLFDNEMNDYTTEESEDKEEQEKTEIEPIFDEVEVQELEPIFEDEEEQELGSIDPESELTDEEEQELGSIDPESELTDEEENILTDEEDLIEINEPIISESRIESGNTITDSHADLLLAIYDDVVSETQKLRSVSLNASKGKLEENEYYLRSKEKYGKYSIDGFVDLSDEEEPLKLPCGEYINMNDINEALESLYKKEKGKSYKVEDTNTTYKITKKSISKFKKALKKCSTLKLVKDKKISKTDLFRVYGKERSESIFKKASKYEVGVLESENMVEGDYISRDELISAMSNLFKEKKISWLKRLSENLKRQEKIEEPDFEDNFDLNGDFVISRR